MNKLQPPKKKYKLNIEIEVHDKSNIMQILENNLFNIIHSDSVHVTSGDGIFKLTENENFLPKQEYEKELIKWHKAQRKEK